MESLVPRRGRHSLHPPGSMQRIMESRYPESSSASGIAQFQDATDGVAQKQRKAYLLKKRADEARVQQLRGIFTAFDEDKDGVLSSSELNSALLSLGIEPSARVTSRYQNAALGGRLDLACFIRVTMTRLEDPDSTLPAINDVFAEFDEDGSGKVPLAALLHLLCEVDTASALGIEDVNQLMQMTGILGELQRKDPAALYSTMLDYQALARHMAFPLPTGASAATGTRTPK